MRKTKTAYEEATETYTRELKRLYPDATVDVLPDEPPGGFDYWVYVYLPGRRVRGARMKLLDLEDSIYERFGVSILTFPRSLRERAAA